MGTPLNDPYSNAAQPAKGTGGLQISVGSAKARNAIATATLVTDQPARAARVTVLVAGSAAGSVNDANAIASAAAGNQIFAIPNAIGAYEIDWPCTSGIVVTPGTGQTVSISYV